MSSQVRVNVAIGGPQDADEAKEAIERALHDWNDHNAIQQGFYVHWRRWPRDTAPQSGVGRYGQGETNRQIIEWADLVLMVFKSRLGTKTGAAESGTAEEIRLADELGKPCHVWFFNGDHPDDAEPSQVAALAQFRRELEQPVESGPELGALVGEWAEPKDFYRLAPVAIVDDLEQHGQAWASGTSSGLYQLDPDTANDYSGAFRRLAADYQDRRDLAMEELVGFCESSEDKLLLVVGDAYSGKSALLAQFFAHVDLPTVHKIGFFVPTTPYDKATSAAFLEGVTAQLQGVISGTAQLDRPDRHLLKLKVQQAVEAATVRNERVVLIVDGLDEDRSGAQGSELITDLVTSLLDLGAWVVASVRRGRGPGPHSPLDESGPPPECGRIVLDLAQTEHVRKVEAAARTEVKAVYEAGGVARDVLRYLAITEASYTAAELAELAKASGASVVEDVLTSHLGRCLIRTSRKLSPFVPTEEAFGLAHKELIAQSRTYFHRAAEQTWGEVDAWAGSYRSRDWPEDTPTFLLGYYQEGLVNRGRVTDFKDTLLEPAFQQEAIRRFGTTAKFAELSNNAYWALAEDQPTNFIGLVRLAMLRQDSLSAARKQLALVPALVALGQKSFAQGIALATLAAEQGSLLSRPTRPTLKALAKSGLICETRQVLESVHEFFVADALRDAGNIDEAVTVEETALESVGVFYIPLYVSLLAIAGKHDEAWNIVSSSVEFGQYITGSSLDDMQISWNAIPTVHGVALAHIVAALGLSDEVAKAFITDEADIALLMNLISYARHIPLDETIRSYYCHIFDPLIPHVMKAASSRDNAALLDGVAMSLALFGHVDKAAEVLSPFPGKWDRDYVDRDTTVFTIAKELLANGRDADVQELISSAPTNYPATHAILLTARGQVDEGISKAAALDHDGPEALCAISKSLAAHGRTDAITMVPLELVPPEQRLQCLVDVSLIAHSKGLTDAAASAAKAALASWSLPVTRDLSGEQCSLVLMLLGKPDSALRRASAEGIHRVRTMENLALLGQASAVIRLLDQGDRHCLRGRIGLALLQVGEVAAGDTIANKLAELGHRSPESDYLLIRTGNTTIAKEWAYGHRSYSHYDLWEPAWATAIMAELDEMHIPTATGTLDLEAEARASALTDMTLTTAQLFALIGNVRLVVAAATERLSFRVDPPKALFLIAEAAARSPSPSGPAGPAGASDILIKSLSEVIRWPDAARVMYIVSPESTRELAQWEFDNNPVFRQKFIIMDGEHHCLNTNPDDLPTVLVVGTSPIANSGEAVVRVASVNDGVDSVHCRVGLDEQGMWVEDCSEQGTIIHPYQEVDDGSRVHTSGTWYHDPMQITLSFGERAYVDTGDMVSIGTATFAIV